MSDTFAAPESVHTSEVSAHQKLLSHVKQYPLVISGVETLCMIPYSKELYSSTIPVIKYVRNTQPIKVAMDKCDIMADSLLTQVDNLFPMVKTLEVHDITDPVVRPAIKIGEEVRISFETAHETAMKTVVEPTAKSINGIRYNIHSVMYDENGKSVVTSKLDPIVAPMNEKLEEIITIWVPDIKKVSKDQSSELSRTILILTNIVKNAHEEPEVAPEPAKPASEVQQTS